MMERLFRRGIIACGLGACVMAGGMVSASGTGPPTALSVTESQRGAAPISTQNLPAPAGDTIQSVTDSKGSFILQTQPAKSESGVQIVSNFDPNTHALSTWTQGPNGYVGQPVISQPGPVTHFKGIPTTTSAHTTKKGTAQLDAVVLDICNLYPFGPKAVGSPFGILLVATSIIRCPYPTNIALTVDLQQFDAWVWATVATDGNAVLGAMSLDISADTECVNYGQHSTYNPWEFNNYSVGSVTFAGSTASGSASAAGPVPCSALY